MKAGRFAAWPNPSRICLASPVGDSRATAPTSPGAWWGERCFFCTACRCDLIANPEELAAKLALVAIRPDESHREGIKQCEG